MDVYNETLRATIKTREEMERVVSWFDRHSVYWLAKEIPCSVCKQPMGRPWKRRRLKEKSMRLFGLDLEDYEAVFQGKYGADRIGYLLAWQETCPFTNRFDMHRKPGIVEPPLCWNCEYLHKKGRIKGEVVSVHEARAYYDRCPVCVKGNGACGLGVFCSVKCLRVFLRKARRSAFTFEVLNGRRTIFGHVAPSPISAVRAVDGTQKPVG